MYYTLSILLTLVNLSYSFAVERYYKDGAYHIISGGATSASLIENYYNTASWGYWPNNQFRDNSISFFRDDYAFWATPPAYNFMPHKFSSKCIYYYDDKSIRKEENYKDGLKYGKWIKYYKNGQVLELKNYTIKNIVERNGEEYKCSSIDGKWIWYYSDGSIWKIEEYKMGVPEGDWVYYYNNAGTNALERIYYKIKSFIYGHGEVRWKKSYSYGHLMDYISYYKSGEIKDSIVYKIPKVYSSYSQNHIEKNDIKDGPWIDYHRNKNTVKEIGNYKNGKREGLWKFYHENSELSKIGEYRDGQEQGEWRSFYPSGSLEVQATFKDGKLNGRFNRYYNPFLKIGHINRANTNSENKQISELLSDNTPNKSWEANFNDGKINGESISYSYGGSVSEIINYIDGQQDTWVRFMSGDTLHYANFKYDLPWYEGYAEIIDYRPPGDPYIAGTIIKYYKIDDPNKKIIKEIKYTNGNITGETNFNHDGQLHGKKIEYSYSWDHAPDYGVALRENYINGKLDGPAFRCSGFGDKEYANYKDGNLHGDYSMFSPRIEKGKYNHGIKIGVWYYAALDFEGKVIKFIYDNNGDIVEAVKHYNNYNKYQQIDENFTGDIHIRVSMITGEYEIYNKSGKMTSTGFYNILDYENHKNIHGLFWEISNK